MKRIHNMRKRSVLAVYIVVFYSIWTVWEFWGKSFINDAIKNECMSQFIKSGVIKNLVWTLPAILLIQYFKSDVSITRKEMFSTKISWLKYLPIFIVFTIYILAGSILKNGRLETASNFGFDEVIIVLFVGLTEEMVFRGWLLNATIRKNKQWLYIILNASMFLAIHFPVWICKGVFVSSFTSFQFLEIIILSIVFSYTFINSRNIFVPIILHMYWDLLVFMFI